MSNTLSKKELIELCERYGLEFKPTDKKADLLEKVTLYESGLKEETADLKEVHEDVEVAIPKKESGRVIAHYFGKQGHKYLVGKFDSEDEALHAIKRKGASKYEIKPLK